MVDFLSVLVNKLKVDNDTYDDLIAQFKSTVSANGGKALFELEESMFPTVDHAVYFHPSVNQYLVLSSPERAPLVLKVVTWTDIYDLTVELANFHLKHKLKAEPANVEQVCMFDAIFDPQVKWVNVFGEAGTGKTYVAMASALNLLASKHYKKIIIAKPRNQVLGSKDKAIGEIPGDLNDKMSPIMASFRDSFNKFYPNEQTAEVAWKQYIENKTIEILPLEFLRGRNFSNTLFIIDEAQNASEEQLRTLLTRFEDTCKLIVMGDLLQLDSRSNSLTTPWVTYSQNDLAKESKLVTSLNLVEVKRGELASLANEIIKDLKNQ
jgi:PhoH-like ATPase